MLPISQHRDIEVGAASVAWIRGVSAAGGPSEMQAQRGHSRTKILVVFARRNRVWIYVFFRQGKRWLWFVWLNVCCDFAWFNLILSAFGWFHCDIIMSYFVILWDVFLRWFVLSCDFAWFDEILLRFRTGTILSEWVVLCDFAWSCAILFGVGEILSDFARLSGLLGCFKGLWIGCVYGHFNHRFSVQTMPDTSTNPTSEWILVLTPCFMMRVSES